MSAGTRTNAAVGGEIHVSGRAQVVEDRLYAGQKVGKYVQIALRIERKYEPRTNNSVPRDQEGDG